MQAAQKSDPGDEERSGEPPRRRRLVIVAAREPGAVAPAARIAAATGRRPGVLFQPIIARESGADGLCRWRCAGAEALLRADGGRGLTVRPDELLPLLERAGLLPTLFDYVLGETLGALARWQRGGAPGLGAAVNLHAAALLDEGLPDALAARLGAAGIAPARLTLEISESAPISDLRRAARTLRRVRALGVRVALDDFGAGFSTPTRLHWLECDELKIDRALVHGLEHSDEQRCVVEHLIALAHANGMAALAEGVETEAALEILCEFGCDRAQGYLVARPLPRERLAARARDWHERGAAAGRRERQLPLPGFAASGAGWRAGKHDADV